MGSETLEPAENEKTIREGDAIVNLDFEGYWVHKECGQ